MPPIGEGLVRYQVRGLDSPDSGDEDLSSYLLQFPLTDHHLFPLFVIFLI